MRRPDHSDNDNFDNRVRELVARLIIVGLVLAVGGCSNAIDVICPPAGQCPNTRSAHGGGY
ncbi:MAG: hypothetical protein ACREE2_12745 [Stellaceae bacterium]